MVKLSVQTAFAENTFLKPSLLEYYETLPAYQSPHVSLVEGIKQRAREEMVPIISDDVFCFLSQLVLTKSPKRILEVGVGGCYSTLAMLENFNGDDFISLEVSDQAIMKAMELRDEYDVLKQAQFVFCNALDYLAEAPKESFDLIFVDIQKKHYETILKYSEEWLSPRGLIVFDNLFFSGHVCGTAETDKGQERKSEIIRRFNENFLSCEFLTTAIYPIGDGLGFGVKRP